MQGKTDPPRDDLSVAEVEEILSHAVGARIRWGLEIRDSNGQTRAPVVIEEDTDEDWNDGTLDAGLTVQDGYITA